MLLLLLLTHTCTAVSRRGNGWDRVLTDPRRPQTSDVITVGGPFTLYWGCREPWQISVLVSSLTRTKGTEGFVLWHVERGSKLPARWATLPDASSARSCNIDDLSTFSGSIVADITAGIAALVRTQASLHACVASPARCTDKNMCALLCRPLPCRCAQTTTLLTPRQALRHSRSASRRLSPLPACTLLSLMQLTPIACAFAGRLQRGGLVQRCSQGDILGTWHHTAPLARCSVGPPAVPCALAGIQGRRCHSRGPGCRRAAARAARA